MVSINEEIECDECGEFNHITNKNTYCEEQLNDNDLFMDINSFLNTDNLSLPKNSNINRKKIDKIIKEWRNTRD